MRLARSTTSVILEIVLESVALLLVYALSIASGFVLGAGAPVALLVAYDRASEHLRRAPLRRGKGSGSWARLGPYR